jgi:hypothetical protein
MGIPKKTLPPAGCNLGFATRCPQKRGRLSRLPLQACPIGDGRKEERENEDSTFRTCFASGYEAETQWAKLQNGAQASPCSGTTGRAQKPFCTRSTKSQAIDVSPNRFSNLLHPCLHFLLPKKSDFDPAAGNPDRHRPLSHSPIPPLHKRRPERRGN